MYVMQMSQRNVSLLLKHSFVARMNCQKIFSLAEVLCTMDWTNSPDGGTLPIIIDLRRADLKHVIYQCVTVMLS